jgi:tetratricopeptide (TPR) repeat protein
MPLFADGLQEVLVAVQGLHWQLLCVLHNSLSCLLALSPAGLQNWAEAERCFGKAAALAPSFSFAAANHTLALYQLGRTEEAIR